MIGWKSRDRAARSRGRARFLSALLYAQQRDPRGRGRRHGRGGQAARRGHLWEARERARPFEARPAAGARSGGAPRKLVLSDERVAQPTLQRMYLVPSYTTGKPGEAEALEVLAQASGAHATGRLNKRLVLDRKLAVAASAWYSGNALDDHTFGVYAVPAEGVSLEELETALDETLDALSRDGADRCRDRACQDAARRRSRLSRTTATARLPAISVRASPPGWTCRECSLGRTPSSASPRRTSAPPCAGSTRSVRSPDI